MKLYTNDYFKNIWKIVWRMTRTYKGKAVNTFVNKMHFKHTNKMYIIANMLYKSRTIKNTPNFSGVNLKFEV